MNICGLRTNLDDVESFLLVNTPDILALSETNLHSSIPSNHFNMPGYLPLCRKDSDRHMHGLGVYICNTLPLTRETKLESDDQAFMCFRLNMQHNISYLYFLYRSPSTQDCTLINKVSDSIDIALSLDTSAQVHVFGDFNVHHNNWLGFSNYTDVAQHIASLYPIPYLRRLHSDTFPRPARSTCLTSRSISDNSSR